MPFRRQHLFTVPGVRQIRAIYHLLMNPIYVYIGLQASKAQNKTKTKQGINSFFFNHLTVV